MFLFGVLLSEETAKHSGSEPIWLTGCSWRNDFLGFFFCVLLFFYDYILIMCIDC